MTYLLEIAFSGAAYSGFQIQKNAKTVAGELTRASRLLFGAECKVQGCSRTDAGVHARQFYASVHTGEGANAVPADRVPAALNCILPYDIAVLDARIASDGYNPRFGTVMKRYEYIIYNRPGKDPFSHRLKLHYRQPLDAAMLDREAKDYVGTHDFTSFMAAGSDVKSTVRTVFSSYVERRGDDVVFSVSADGFLYNMVRIMAGTLLCISEGKIARGSIPDIIAAENRNAAGITVPPDGLYLSEVILR